MIKYNKKKGKFIFLRSSMNMIEDPRQKVGAVLAQKADKNMYL